MASFPIDLDTEKLQFDGQWYSRDELAKRIKSMLDSGDFQVSRISQALEALTATLANLKTLSLRLTPEQNDAIAQAAAKQGKSAGALVRDALAAYFGSGRITPESNGGQRPAAGAGGSASSGARVAVPLNGNVPHGATVSGTLPAPGGPSHIVTEDASPDEAASAVSLTPKRKDEEQPVERGWFGA